MIPKYNPHTAFKTKKITWFELEQRCNFSG